MGSFWGLTVEPSKKYSQTVEFPFTVTSAAIDPSGDDKEDTVLYLAVDGQEFVLCTLNKGKWPQHRLETRLDEGTDISFFVRGNSKVHMTGYMEPEESDEFGSDEEIDSDDMGVMLHDGEYDDEDEDDDDDDEEEEEDEDGPKFVEIEAEEDDEDEEEGVEGEETWETDEEEEEEEEKPAPAAANKRAAPKGETAQPAKKAKPEPKTGDGKVEVVIKKKEEKKPKPEKAEAPKKNEKPQPQPPQKGKQQKLEGGTIAEDVVIGKGAKAKQGKMVGVYYVGRLAQNNKIFDACQDGRPFKFKLGKGEVIRGWDVGVDGMQVGGKRILRIPPGSAYGARGHPPVIPGNSTLIFEVELKSVK